MAKKREETLFFLYVSGALLNCIKTKFRIINKYVKPQSRLFAGAYEFPFLLDFSRLLHASHHQILCNYRFQRLMLTVNTHQLNWKSNIKTNSIWKQFPSKRTKPEYGLVAKSFSIIITIQASYMKKVNYAVEFLIFVKNHQADKSFLRTLFLSQLWSLQEQLQHRISSNQYATPQGWFTTSRLDNNVSVE